MQWFTIPARAIVFTTILLVASGCVSTHDRVYEVAAADMRCLPENVAVSFDSRPYVGTTRYTAEGCGKQRMYVCQKVVWFFGLPIGNARCERDKS